MRRSVWLTAFSFVTAVTVLGCGGGGAAGAGGTTGGVSTETSVVGSARVTVDLLNNRVTVKPTEDSRAIFSSGAVSFTANTVLNEGTPARKVINVTLRDNSTEQALTNAGSFRVLFSSFRNLNTPPTSLTGTVKTTTFSGTTNGTAVDGNILNAVYNFPNFLAYEKETGTLYVAEGVGAKTRIIRNGTVTSVDGFDAATSMVAIPPCVRFPQGAGLVTDRTANAIFSLEPSGRVTRVAGTGATGQSNGGTAAQATFLEPKGMSVIVNPSKTRATCWMVDQVFGSALRSLTLDLTLTHGLSDFVSGPYASPGNGSTTATDGNLLYVSGLSNVWALSLSNLTAASTGPTALIGTFTPGFADGIGTSAQFQPPAQMAVVDGILYVADASNHRVRQIARREGSSGLSGSDYLVSTLSGTGVASEIDGTTSMTHNTPYGLASMGGAGLFVSGNQGGRIRTIQPLDSKFTVLTGNVTSIPTDLPALANADGYVPSVPVRTPYQESPAPAPASQSRGVPVELPLKPWKFIVPSGTQSFDFVVTIEAKTNTLASLPSRFNAGPTGSGSADVNVRTVVGGIATGGSVDGPSGVGSFTGVLGMATDSNGYSYVCDSAKTIRVVAPDGSVSTVLGRVGVSGSTSGVGSDARLLAPGAIGCSPDGSELYISDASTVRLASYLGGDRRNPSSWSLSGPIAGATSTTGNASATPVAGNVARFVSIGGIAYAGPNTINLVDSANRNVQSLTIGSGQDRTLAANWTVQLTAGSLSGVSGFVDGVGQAALFNFPIGITVGPTGEIYVADSSNNAIRVVLSDGSVTTFAGQVTTGYADGTGVAAKFTTPNGVAVDGAGYVYVADTGNRVVRRISPQKSVTTVAGSAGSSGFLDGTGVTARLGSIRAISIVPSGDVYVGDTTRLRLLERIIRD